MVVGGEDFKTSLAAAVSTQLQDQVELYNEYGPTEAVVGCVAHRYDPKADIDASVPIGVPTDHVEIDILNEALSPVPEGVPGELWISRFGLARGYWGLEELTAKRFHPHPFRPGQRWYRTGDLVRMASPSKLEYLGRLDRQLKVSGFRVEPGEIETALLSLPSIEQCAVIARRRRPPAIGPNNPIRTCIRCGLPSNYPRAFFDEEGVCSVCRSYESVKGHAEAYFKTMDDLRAVFEESRRIHRSKYDCMMLYSGGKDSSYALCRLVEMGLSVYAFTLDNGFISEGAKDNIRKVTQQLDVTVEFGETPAMNAIFRDSLMRFANVCNGCFKTIYTLSLTRARELSIPIIVTGLSRGQMFETRLTEEMFRDGQRTPEEVDAAVLAARKVYHRVADEASRLLDVTIFEDDRIFEEIQFVDFYRYCDVGMDEMLSYLTQKVPWVRPKDTGRSTNCLINDVGIYVHKKERGYHNYALPYSWDVRLGHKTREGALDELNDTIDVSHVEKTLAEIGYDEARDPSGVDQTALEAFYVGSEDLTDQELRRQLGERLPPQLIPAHLQRVDSIPLTASGKVDEKALSREAVGRRPEKPYRAPEGPVEEYLVGVWQEELGVERVGADDSFFELGGTSLTAMQVMLRLCREFDIDLPLESMFLHPSLGELAKLAEETILADVAEIPEADRQRLLEDPT
jgi:acyl-CoA synthetase (AMP-forming)/AMP-acid ligase II/acyl carrier protein